MEPNSRSCLSCVLWCTARHSLTRVGWPLLRQDPSHQVQRRPDRRLSSSQSMRCFYSYLAPLFLFLSWSPSRSVPSSSSFSSCHENGFFSSRILRMYYTVWFLTSFPNVLFADFAEVFFTGWFLVAHAGFAEVFFTGWFFTSFPNVLFADFTDVFCTEWFLVAHS